MFHYVSISYVHYVGLHDMNIVTYTFNYIYILIHNIYMYTCSMYNTMIVEYSACFANGTQGPWNNGNFRDKRHFRWSTRWLMSYVNDAHLLVAPYGACYLARLWFSKSETRSSWWNVSHVPFLEGVFCQCFTTKKYMTFQLKVVAGRTVRSRIWEHSWLLSHTQIHPRSSISCDKEFWNTVAMWVCNAIL